MDAEALRTFLLIHETGGFSSAATRLGRSQPAISRRIALLEDELGAPLFERVAGGVALSQAGEVLVPHARRVLAAVEDGAAAVAALLTGSAGPLSLAMVGTLAGAAVTPRLKRFSQAHPGVALGLRTASSAEVSELVRRGEAVMGLRYHRDPASDLDCAELAAEPLRIVCAPDHARAGKTLRSLRPLAGERWLGFPNAQTQPDNALHLIFAQLRVLGITPPDWLPVDSLTAQKRLVEAGYGIAVLPASAIAEELAAGSLATIAIAGIELANPVCLVTRRGGYLGPAAQALIAALRGL